MIKIFMWRLLLLQLRTNFKKIAYTSQMYKLPFVVTWWGGCHPKPSHDPFRKISAYMSCIILCYVSVNTQRASIKFGFFNFRWIDFDLLVGRYQLQFIWVPSIDTENMICPCQNFPRKIWFQIDISKSLFDSLTFLINERLRAPSSWIINWKPCKAK